MGNKKNLAVLATGSGKTYLACLASYRLLNYTPTKRILFLVDRNNLARQTESEFSVFDRTEGQQKMGNLYTINRLKKEEDIKGDIVISTIQKLFCVLTGQVISDSDEDAEDEKAKEDEEKNSKTVIELGNDLKLPPDYFQLIIVDECHRSIYGKWKKVLDYFSGATVLGLTATPTPEAYVYFNKNVIEEYTYDDSVVDGVNVPPRVCRIITDVTAHGGTIEKGTKIIETAKRTRKSETIDVGTSVEYGAAELDRSVVNKKQIKEVLMAYKKSIYEDLYPNREKKWEYIPKTLIFAKDDNHATEIVDIAKDVFKFEFENEAQNDKMNITQRLLAEYKDISQPECIEEYYEEVFFLKQENIQKNTMHIKCRSFENLPFQTYAEQFELIPDRTCSIVVPRDEKSRKLVDTLRYTKIENEKELQKYTCTVTKKELDELIKQHVADDFGTGIYCLTNEDYYDENLGILLEAQDYFL